MKYLKMLGLATVAVAALMAFAGAGTASADELCTEKANAENMCPAGKLITEVNASLTGSAELTDTEGTVLDTCTAGTVKITNITPTRGGVVNNETGSNLLVGDTPEEDITWGTETTKCSFVTKTVLGGTVDAEPAAGGGTTLTATTTRVTINTVLFGSCVYGVSTGVHLGAVAQGGNTLTIKAGVKKISGFVCPETTVWSATYKVTNHNAVFYIAN